MRVAPVEFSRWLSSSLIGRSYAEFSIPIVDVWVEVALEL